MDRETQLSNVAFGGAWSEEIAGQEALQRARRVLEDVVERSVRADLRTDREVHHAVQLLAAHHPKGAMLIYAWEKACSVEHAVLRRSEVQRIANTLTAILHAA